MSGLLVLLPIALFLGGLGLAAFLWSLHSGQYEDMDGAAERILMDDDRDGQKTPAAADASMLTGRHGAEEST